MVEERATGWVLAGVGVAVAWAILGALAYLASPAPPMVSADSTDVADRPAVPAAPTVTEPGRRPPGRRFDAAAVRGDLFAPAATRHPTASSARPVPRPASPAGAPDPLARCSYVGIVRIGGRALALVEDTRTRAGRYVVAGDALAGGTVARVTEDAVTVRIGRTVRSLPMGRAARLTPLDRSAPYLRQPAAPPPLVDTGPGTPPPASPAQQGVPAPAPAEPAPAPGEVAPGSERAEPPPFVIAVGPLADPLGYDAPRALDPAALLAPSGGGRLAPAVQLLRLPGLPGAAPGPAR